MAPRKSKSKARGEKKTPRKYSRSVALEMTQHEDSSLASSGKPLTLTQRVHAAEARAERAEADAREQSAKRFERETVFANNARLQQTQHNAEVDAKLAEIAYLRSTLSRITLGGVFVTGTMKA